MSDFMIKILLLDILWNLKTLGIIIFIIIAVSLLVGISNRGSAIFDDAITKNKTFKIIFGLAIAAMLLIPNKETLNTLVADAVGCQDSETIEVTNNE